MKAIGIDLQDSDDSELLYDQNNNNEKNKGKNNGNSNSN